MTNEDLLIECDSILSLIFYREKAQVSKTTLEEIARLLPDLRLATNKIVSVRRNPE